MKNFATFYDASASPEDVYATCEKGGLMSPEDKERLDALCEAEQPTVDKETIGLGNVTNDAQVKRSEMGVANGVATLDDAGFVPTSQLPGFIDDVVEYENAASFPEEGEGGKLYIAMDENKTYRWSGSQYSEIVAGGITLGSTSSTAYPGDLGTATTNAVNAIIDGTTVVPNAVNARTVDGFTVAANVPDDAVFTDTVYTHPEDENTRHVTDEQISNWDAKADIVVFEPFFQDGSFYACGVPVVIEDAGNGNLVAKWNDREDKTLEFPEGSKVFGGGLGKEVAVHYPSTCVTLNSGKVQSLYGGSDLEGTVGTSTLVINGGTITSGIIVGGRGAHGDKNLVGHGELVVNNVDSTLTIYGGPQGLGTVGSTKVTVNNGNIDWLTAGGSNGFTGVAEITVNGGTVEVLQGCNRGTMGNIKMTINGGTIDRVYAGGETEDKSVNATYVKSEVFVNGGIIGKISAGTNGGVEDASKVSGNYVEGVITNEAAAAMNLVKAPIVFNNVVLEGKTLIFKNGETIIEAIDLSSIIA